MIACNRALALVLISAALSVRAAAAPAFVEIDYPGAGTAAGQGTQAFAINGAGDISAEYIDQFGTYRGFIRSANGSTVFIDVNDLQPPAINKHERMTGSTFDDFSGTRGFIVGTDNVFISLDAPGANKFTIGEGITASGEVAGTFRDFTGLWHGFLFTQHAKYKVFDAPDASGATYAHAINDQGFICGSGGTHGYVRDPHGRFTTFDPAGSAATTPVAINARGAVGGSYLDASSIQHGFLRGADGTIVAIDPPAGFKSIAVTSLSGREVSAGTAIDNAGVAHGFIRSSAGHLVFFDAPGAGTGSGQGTFARSINNRKQISGYYTDAAGVFHGYIRTP